MLDPTCGSGAFLFAALNILKPLYDATLRTLQAVRADALMTGDTGHPEKWAEVDELLARFVPPLAQTARRTMRSSNTSSSTTPTAWTSRNKPPKSPSCASSSSWWRCREPGDHIEPLPDIDFNIRHGNTLVGYATADETEKAVKGATQGNLFSDAWEDIRIRLVAVEQQYNNFQIQQVQQGGHVTGLTSRYRVPPCQSWLTC